jgi:hypothetical protein
MFLEIIPNFLNLSPRKIPADKRLRRRDTSRYIRRNVFFINSVFYIRGTIYLDIQSFQQRPRNFPLITDDVGAARSVRHSFRIAKISARARIHGGKGIGISPAIRRLACPISRPRIWPSPVSLGWPSGQQGTSR